MTLRRVVTLAQALTMILLLLPGPLSIGPTAVHAALRPAEPDSGAVFDAEGKGIGCQTGGRKYKGPGLPKDPPWPPGAEPTPTPAPSPSPLPSVEASDEASAEPTAEPTAEASAEPEAVVMGFASGELQVAQAELAAAPTATPRPRNRLITGIDVSHHNGDIDYQAVKQAGHRFVFIKATQDNDFIDPMFPTNLARARAAGLAAGAYHFFDYTLDGREQADHFLDHVERAGGVVNALPPVVDVECWAPIGSSIHAVSAARLRDFVERVYERTGLLPLVYTSVHMWQEVVGNASGFEDLPMWAACWGCDVPPSIAPGWEEWAFWQEGLTRIPGVGRLDGNYYSGSRKELRAFKTKPFSIANGAASSGGGTVELDLGGRTGTHIRTSPDGASWSAWSRLRETPTAQIPATEGEHSVFVQLRNGPGLKSPVLSDSVVVDATPPELSAPVVSLRQAALSTSAASVPVVLTWDARDVTAGLADAKVAVSCGEGQFQRTDAPGHAEPGELAPWEAEAWLFPEAACNVTAIATDGAGNTARETHAGARVGIVPAAGDLPSAVVSGDQFGVVAQRGPVGGRAAVLVDGDAVALIDLYAPVATGPEVVYVADLAAGEHTVAVDATETSDPLADGSAVTVEGFATLAR